MAEFSYSKPALTIKPQTHFALVAQDFQSSRLWWFIIITKKYSFVFFMVTAFKSLNIGCILYDLGWFFLMTVHFK